MVYFLVKTGNQYFLVNKSANPSSYGGFATKEAALAFANNNGILVD